MKQDIYDGNLVKVPHLGKEISFATYPFSGKYGEIARKIDDDGLRRPTSSEVASLFYAFFKAEKNDGKNPFGSYGLLDRCFIEFTGNLYLPKSSGKEFHNGVIIEDNPTIRNGWLYMDKCDLAGRLRSNDPSVRFVPFGYKWGAQSVRDFEKNPYIIAKYGEEGASKVAEISSGYSLKPYLDSYGGIDSEDVSISSIETDLWSHNRVEVAGRQFPNFLWETFSRGIFPNNS